MYFIWTFLKEYNLSVIDPPAIARPVINTIVVPSSLYNAMVRSGLHLMDLTIYSKLRKIASLEEIAVYAALNETLSVGGQRLSTASLSSIISRGDGNQVEMDAVFSRMANTDEIRKLAINSIEVYADPFEQMLKLKVNPSAAVTVQDTSLKNTLGSPLTASADLPYQLKTSGSNVFIVVGSGFNKYVGAPLSTEGPKQFVRSFLELCTDMFSASEVARHPLFKSFLYTLAE